MFKRLTLLAMAATIGAGTIAAPAAAEDHTGIEKGDVLIRLRGIGVLPQASSGPVLPTFPTGRVTVGDSYVPEIDFTYMLTNHLGLELIAAVTNHTAYGRDALAPVGKIGDIWVLPPTLTLQYHFMPQTKFRPYLGFGINQTWYFHGTTGDVVNAALGPSKFSLSPSFGYAAQAGFDIDITKRIFLNFDVKYVDMRSTARVFSPGVTNAVRVNISPIIAGVGVGMRF